MLAATALVLLMTPGLAFFYGGMTRAKTTLNMMMMSWIAIVTVTIAWVLYGDSLSFSKGNGFIGGFQYLGEKGLVNSASPVSGIPDLLFSAFQLTFAVITVALISGAIADRTKFGAWAVFTVAWATLVYFPVAHWVWGGGWLSSLGIEDFAGGTVVHVNAGSAGLALALVLGKRRGYGKDPMRPHNLPLVLLGAGLLWFGWFGFNAGSELAADGTAALAFMNTQIATAAAAGGWLLGGRDRGGQADHARRGLRRGGRAGRHHPGLCLHRPLGGHRARPAGRGHLLLRDRPEAPARLRRRARRGRRAPGRRRVRCHLAGLPGRLPDRVQPAQGIALRRRCQAARGAGPRAGRGRLLLVRGGLGPRQDHRQDDGLPGL